MEARAIPVACLALGLSAAATAGAGAVMAAPLVAGPTGALNPDIEFSAASSSLQEDGAAVAVEVTLSATSTSDITIPFTVTGSATAADGTVAASPLVISAGQTTGTILVTPIDDMDSEGRERFTITLGTPSEGALGAQISHDAILADDEPAAVLEFASAAQSVSESAGVVPVQVTLSAARTEEARVTFTQTGTASPSGVDFSVSPPSPLIVPAGQTTASFDVAIVSDTIDEVDETFISTLLVPINCQLGAVTQTTLTILDDDDPPVIEFAQPGQIAVEDAGTLPVAVQLSNASDGPVEVTITGSGSATEGSDYGFTPTVLTIPAGVVSGQVDVTLTDDAAVESLEVATLELSAPTGGTLGTAITHDLTIVDDDGPTPDVEFSSAGATVSEDAGTQTLRIQLSSHAVEAVTVPLSTSGTADPVTDFVLAAVDATIPLGELFVDVDLDVVDDSAMEPSETVTVQLGAPSSGAVLGVTDTYTLTIDDDDGGVSASFLAATSMVSETVAMATIDVELSGPAPADVTIPLVITGTAASGAGGDYDIAITELVIATGQSMGQIPVTFTDDVLYEGDETIEVAFGAITGATVGAVSSHVLTIVEDDPVPTVQFTAFRFVAAERDEGFDLNLTLDAPAGIDVQVPYTATGNAAGPDDVTLPPSPLVIPAGQTSVAIPVGVIWDGLFENHDTVLFTLEAPTGATLGPVDSYLVLISDFVAAGPFGTLPPPLVPSLTELQFPLTRSGDLSPTQRVQYTNVHPVAVDFADAWTVGPNASDFLVSFPTPPPAVVAPGQSFDVDVAFSPKTRGVRDGRLRARQAPQGAPPASLRLSGTAIGVPGDEVRMNASAEGFVSPAREFWCAEYGVLGGSTDTYPGAVAGTTLDDLYRTIRFGPQIDYAIEVPSGAYELVLRSWEPIKTGPGERLMDVTAEGVLVLDDLDVWAEVGADAAYESAPIPVTITDGMFDLRIEGVVAQAIVSAFELRSVPVLSSPTTVLDFATVDQGSSSTLDIEINNDGLQSAVLDRLTFEVRTVGDARDFSVTSGGTTYTGLMTTVVRSPNIVLSPGLNLIPVAFTPTIHEDNIVTLRLEATADGFSHEVELVATGGAEAGWGFLHPVPDHLPVFVVDYDGNGSEEVQLLGAESHTHEPGHVLVGHDWSVAGTPVASAVNTTAVLPVGPSLVELTITDDNVPAATASDSLTIVVHPVDDVPGVLAEYYDGSVVDEVTLLDAVPARPDFIARKPEVKVEAQVGKVGDSEFTGDVMVRLSGTFTLTQARTLEFGAVGGVDNRLLLNGVAPTGPQSLTAGTHALELRFAVSELGDLPLELSVLDGGIPAFDVLASFSHDEQGVAPVIHSMPTVGTDLGGNRITIDGFGFFPEASTVVHWGATDITSAQFDDWNGEFITLTTPPGTGTVQVTVETPQGTSNAVSYAYSPTGPIPVRFDVLSAKEVTLSNVTSATWGPDGKLYVTVIDGTLRALSFDDTWSVTGIQFMTGLSGLSNADTMACAFNPYDVYDPQDPTSLKLYVSHGEQFQNGGGAFTGPSYFTGQISMLAGPNFDNPVPVVSNLSVSNHDHAINGIFFDDNGDLMICAGGNTNAGVQAQELGDIPEGPLSAAILRARTSSPTFNGLVLYQDSVSGVFVDDQVFSEQVDVAPGVDVEVFAAGFRNPLDMVLHTNGYLYATDNGPNRDFGPASVTLTTDSGQPFTRPDELNLIEKGKYYGSANRNRGRYFPREATFYPAEAPSIPDVHTRPLTTLNSSTNGITEYRATAFNSAMRGDLVAMKWNEGVYRIELTDAGRRVQTKTLYNQSSNTAFPPNGGLDVVYGPGGALIAIDYTFGKVRVQVPQDIAAVGLTPYDITPWRVPAGGGQPFVIGGVGFGTDLAAVSVTIGGTPAQVDSVSDTRIRGIFPASASGAATGLLDVVVTVGPDQRVIPGAMRYMPAQPGQALGTWQPDSVLPLQLGEVSSVVLDGKLYVFGQGDGRTMVRDFVASSWNLNLAQRPFPGNHHGLEVVDGKIYLIGGLDGGSAGKVQIYDPALDTWTLGAPMPWNGGSCATALIDGMIYVGGGNLQGAGTASNFAVYDPTLDSWTPLGIMPTPVNHAAAGTDGTRMFIFGGRQGMNVPQPGFDDVQIYDPVAGTWETSDALQVAPMPLPRGGTGRAVFVGGEFYIMGGEDASVAFGDVQVYRPDTDTWRTEAPMLTPRHGIFPTLYEGRIHVVGGGLNAGFGFSAVHEVFSPR